MKEKSATLCFQVDVKSLSEQSSVLALNSKKGMLEFVFHPQTSSEQVKVWLLVRLGDKVLLKE